MSIIWLCNGSFGCLLGAGGNKSYCLLIVGELVTVKLGLSYYNCDMPDDTSPIGMLKDTIMMHCCLLLPMLCDKGLPPIGAMGVPYCIIGSMWKEYKGVAPTFSLLEIVP